MKPQQVRWLAIFLIIIAVVCIVVGIHATTRCSIREMFSIDGGPLQFLTSKELHMVLQQDEYDYLSNMTTNDRGARTTCAMRVSGILPEWTPAKQRKVENAIANPRKKLFTNIKFGLSDRSRECGYPHTRGHSTIVVPVEILDNSDLSTTLLHELVHIKQKQYPELFEELYSTWGFKPWNGNLPQAIHERRRNNPDVYPMPYWIWRDTWIPLALYRAYPPKVGIDISNPMVADYVAFNVQDGFVYENNPLAGYFNAASQQPEHPNEISAIMLAKLMEGGQPGYTEPELQLAVWFEKRRDILGL